MIRLANSGMSEITVRNSDTVMAAKVISVRAVTVARRPGPVPGLSSRAISP